MRRNAAARREQASLCVPARRPHATPQPSGILFVFFQISQPSSLQCGNALYCVCVCVRLEVCICVCTHAATVWLIERVLILSRCQSSHLFKGNIAG